MLTYTDSIQFLYGLRLFGTKMGLENTFRLAAMAGNPQQRLRFIHVAGTNGKGSTCAMLESIYRGAGLRVGLFTSPHLVSFRERIQVNRQLVSEADVIGLVDEAQRALREFPASRHPTFFEFVTVMALQYFAEQQCGLVIWETGLGGRLDATNIVTPLASVITNVQLDHERWLGNTVSQIASEKAGIIKSRVPVVTASDSAEAIEVIRNTAAREHAPLTCVTWSDTARPPLGTIQLSLLGDHQRINAALAAATVRVLGGQIQIEDQVLRDGLLRVHWPGRLQRHATRDGRLILLDGAHNPAGVESLRSALHRYFPDQRPTFILGLFRDKDWAAMCRILAPLAYRILLAPVHSDRTAVPAELQRVCIAIEPGLETVLCSSLSEALNRTQQDPIVVITGSLHFVGEALELLELLPISTEERHLNEWDAAGAGRSRSTALLP